MRNVLLPSIIDDPEHDPHYFVQLNPTTTDYKHINKHGHQVLADMLSAYTQRQLCRIHVSPSRKQRPTLSPKHTARFSHPQDN